MKKIFALVITLMLIASSAFAEKITFVEYASYHLGSGDSEITAHEGARNECLKKAAAAGGVYVQMYSQEHMFELTAHETEVLAASVIKAVEIEGESGMSKDRMNYDIAMECTLDTDDIYKVLQNRKSSGAPVTSNNTPVQPTKNITNSSTDAHAFLLNCDHLKVTPTSSPDYFWLATDYLIIETESGKTIMDIDGKNSSGYKWLVDKVRSGSHGFDKNIKEYIDRKWGDDYEVIYAIKVKEYGEEKMGYIERKKIKWKHVIVVSDEDGEKILNIINNNPGRVMSTNNFIVTWLM